MPQDASPAGRGVEQEAGRQTGAGTGPDRLREEILGAAGEAARRLAPALPEDLPVLLRHLFEALPTAELAAESPEALAAAAISLWSLASERRPAEAKLRLQPPGPGRGGALLEIVTDDMPFLVDSAMAALTLSGRTVRRLLHPVMTVRRDAGGRLLGFGPRGPAESMMRIEISPAPARLLGEDAAPPEDWPGVEATLRRTLADLRQAVSDYPAMRAQLRLAAQDVAGAPSGAEVSDFLRWLDEDNFVLLGHRRLRLEAPDGVAPGGTTPAGTREDEGLGLLRDPALPVFDALPPLPEGEAARAAIPALTVAKAGTRARVHRPVHLDLILTPVVLEGRVVAVHGFLGLFAATAYNRNPRSIPWLSSKVQRILDAAGAMPESHDERALRFILDTWPRDELFQAGEAEILAAARRVLDLQLRPRPALMLRRDPSGRSVAAIAWLPRDTFDTRLRERVGRLLAAAFDGRLASVSVALGDGPLARVHYIIATTAGAVPQVDDAVLEAAMTQAARSFADRLGDALARDRGEDEAARLLARWAEGFPPAYREETP
ncbi:MAG: NAD-glutamate dehydrogenase, partial [Roseomonas mucosa]|nr:NAD-glutamate dehydrogenase [Roseomonas mucosa]